MSEEGEYAAIGEGRRRRRSWSAEEKRRIVTETFAPGASVSIVARRHDMNANMLFTWRREMAAAAAGDENAVRFVPATIAAEVAPTALPAPPAKPGRMEIVLAAGDRVIVGADVDAAALTRVMKVLGRR
ncbi:MAG: IS66-like element accessory protein TnpA [Stellaceae bacterium]